VATAPGGSVPTGMAFATLQRPGARAYDPAVGTQFTIGQLAAAAGIPTTTVRYYERRRLLRAALRIGSGQYRLYGAAELERLRFIRAAQTLGFSLDDIARLLALDDGRSAPCAEVQALIEARLSDISERMSDLRRVQRALRGSLDLCRGRRPEGGCAVIDGLASPPHHRLGRRR
jgi:MerR family copper efflux transcriptional regulator